MRRNLDGTIKKYEKYTAISNRLGRSQNRVRHIHCAASNHRRIYPASCWHSNLQRNQGTTREGKACQADHRERRTA